MEYLLFIAIVLALIEWRDVKQNKRYEAIENQLAISNAAIVSILEKHAKKVSEDFHALSAEIRPLKEFLDKAHTDLGTIVKEYEINGIPMHLQRGGKMPEFDAVEGL